jgi:diguanylate cyclase (GGDEF)-like protein/PAS domain S-box-containing protein
MFLRTHRSLRVPSRRRHGARSLETRFRSAAILLLLPCIAVSAVSGMAIILSRSVAAALQGEQDERKQLDAVKNDLHEVALAGTTFLLSQVPEEQKTMATAAQQVDADLAASARLTGLTPSQTVLLAAVNGAWTDTLGIRRSILAEDPSRPPSSDIIKALEEGLNSRITAISAQADEIQAISAGEASGFVRQQNIVDQVAPVVVILALLFGLSAGWWISRRLARSILLPLSTLSEAADRIAADEQGARVNVTGPPEIEALGSAFNDMAARLAERQTAVDRHQRLLALMENTTDGILVISSEGDVVFATPGFSADFATENAAGSDLRGLVHPEDIAHVEKAYARSLAGADGTASEVEARLRDRNGEWRHVWVKLTNRLADPAVSGIVANLTDVTERREHEEQLTHQALHDPLTGLANRRLFLERLHTATAARHKGDRSVHSLVYIDFDDFKQINDTLGHKAGDDFLVAMAHRLLDCVRPEDIVARLGGDEYTVLLKDTNGRDAVVVVERMIAALGVPWSAAGKEIHPRASIGVVSRHVSATTAETLLADGDLAMYFAKRQGKARYEVFSETMRSELLERLKLGEDLRAAVGEGALAVQYQPIIDLRKGGIFGVEALVRWQHPTRGWIGPATFIPLAEEIGLVHQIDMWVLQVACRQGHTWHRDGLGDVRVAVNLSGSDLEDPGLVATVARTLTETDFDAPLLELELTEGAAIFESAKARDTLQNLKGLGVRLAIDDFGTGYSALGRLQSLPFDRLKVDKVFIDELTGAQGGTTLVESILEMARVLGLEVVAEGVETAEQADFLRGHDCGFAQGYLFSRPVDAVQLEALLRLQLASSEAGTNPPPIALAV